MMEQCVVDMRTDHRHILPVFNLIQKRKKSQTVEDVVLDMAAKTDFTNFGKMDDTEKMQWIAAKSGLSSQETVDFAKADAHGAGEMLPYALQISGKTRLPKWANYVEVLSRWMDMRYVECGERLKDFRARGGLKADGTWDMRAIGCYRVDADVEGRRLAQVRHANGDVFIFTQEFSFLTTAYKLVDNHCDWSAALVVSPVLPAIYLHKLFDEAQLGPFRVSTYVQKPKELDAKFLEIYKAWEIEARGLVAVKTQDSVIVDGITEHKKSQQKAIMTKARDQAQKTMSSKKTRRCLDLE